MSDSVAAPSDAEVATLNEEFSDEEVETHRAGEKQVANRPGDVANNRALRQRQRARELAQGPLTGYGKVGQTRIGDLPANASGVNTANREKIAARDNERSVPDLPAEKLIEWVNRDPERAKAVELSQAGKEEPDEELLAALAETVGVDGADIRAERDAAEADAEVVRQSQRDAVEDAR